MKKSRFVLALLCTLATSTAFAFDGGRGNEGGGHVGIDAGTSYLPYASTTFGYNVEAGKAWVIVEFGQYEGVDGGQLWNSVQKEMPVEGLTLNTATNDIELFGVPCANARPHKAFSGADYPIKDYKSCTITPSYVTTVNFKGESIVHTTITLSSER